MTSNHQYRHAEIPIVPKCTSSSYDPSDSDSLAGCIRNYQGLFIAMLWTHFPVTGCLPQLVNHTLPPSLQKDQKLQVLPLSPLKAPGLMLPGEHEVSMLAVAGDRTCNAGTQ